MEYLIDINKKMAFELDYSGYSNRIEYFNDILFMKGYIVSDNDYILDIDYCKENIKKNNINQFICSDGSYCMAFQCNNSIILTTDLFGIQPLFYSIKYKIICTSFYGMICYLIKRGEVLTFDHKYVSVMRRYMHFTDCSFSSGTIVEGVSLCLSSQYLIIKDSEIIVNESHKFQEECDSLDYKASIIKGISSIVGKINFANKIAKNTAFVSLSGGIDSRIILSAANFASDFPDIFSGGEERDKTVASILCKILNISPLNKFPQSNERLTLSSELSLERWKYYSLGYYHFLNISSVYNINPLDNIELRGVGGEIMRPFYTESDQSNVSLYDYLTDYTIQSLCDKNFSRYEAHYMIFRNRIHGGRNIDNAEGSVLRLDPMINKYSYISSIKSNMDRKMHNGILFDYQYLLNSQLAFIDYDEQKKKHRPSIIKNSPFFIDESEVLHYGSPISIIGDSINGYGIANTTMQNLRSGTFDVFSVLDIMTNSILKNKLVTSDEKRQLDAIIPSITQSNIAPQGRRIARYFAISELNALGVNAS